MQRKAALIGCREGQWIRTYGMRRPRVNARVHRDALVQVEQGSDRGSTINKFTFVGARIELLEESSWTRVSILDGPHEESIVLIESA